MKKFLTPILIFLLIVSGSAVAQETDFAGIRDFRNKLLSDPYRPAYHIAIPEDMAQPFDPDGAIFWNGRYHLFYIYQDHGVHVYGHLSSIDLIHWRQHPKALFPTGEGGIEGIFSGNCFRGKDGKAVMLFHGVGQGNSIAVSDDPLLDHWTMLPSNPIVPDPKDAAAKATEEYKEGGAPYASWDPHGWLQDGTYYAIFGGKRPAVFKADELDEWEYVGDLFGEALPGVGEHEDVSCPDMFTLGNRQVLLCISHTLGCRYYIGKWDNDHFWPESHGLMSYCDNTYFAPESVLTPDGRRIMWTWLFDARNWPERINSGWYGMMSLPRELFLRRDKTLGMRPVKELKQLRYNAKKSGRIKTDNEVVLEGGSGDVKEISFSLKPGKALRSGLRFLSDGKDEYGEVYYDSARKMIVLDVSRLNAVEMEPLSPLGVPFTKVEEAQYELPANGRLDFDVLIDRSIIEVYVNENLALVRTNAFASNGNARESELFAESGTARFRNVYTWDIMPSNYY